MENNLDFTQNDLFSQAFKYAPIGMALVSPEGKWLHVNSSLCQIIGYSESEFLSMTFKDVTHPDDVHRALYIWNQFLDGKLDCYQLEKRYTHKNRFTVWVLLTVSIMRDEHRQPLFFITQIEDITERKLAEEELRLSRESLAVVQRIAQIGNWEADVKTGEIFWSEEHSRILGLNHNEINPSYALFLSLVHPDDRNRVDKMANQALEGKPYELEYRIIRANGEERMIYSKGTVIWDEMGMPLKMNGIIQDITDRIQEQKKLKTSEELFKLISEHAQDIITISSPDGRVEYISPTVHKLLGYDPEEVIGTLSHETFHPDDLIALTKSNFFQDSDEEVFECRVKHKKGHYIWFETNVKIIRNEEGNFIRAIGLGRDISERKQAEEYIRKTKEQFESVIQNNADAIWIIDIEDTISEVNPAFETMFGWSPDEIKGKKLPMIPDFLKDSMDILHQRVKTGETVVSLETIRQRKDSSLLDVEATLSPIRNHTGHVIGITGICRNVTARKRAEQELQAKTQQLESFIEHNADAILIFNNEGVVQRVNQTFSNVFGWSKEEIVGIDILSLPFIPAECLDENTQKREQLKKGQSIIGAETLRKRKDGEILIVLLTSSPIVDGTGNLNGWSTTLRDITEWKKAQEQLQNSEKLSVAGQLAAGIAHEIRNPITSIKGFIHLMKAGFGEKQKYFDIMTSEIERIELILSELLILAKPQSIKYERKDIRVLLSQVMTLLDSQAHLNNVQFTTEFKPGVTHLYCDENQLKQVFINFIKNSIESMPKGGKITIEINSDDQEMLIRLIDQGYGIPKEVLSKLGQPFYTTKEKGTGLGFMVSKKIIENHSGKIHVESEVNKGTIIEIKLPISCS